MVFIRIKDAGSNVRSYLDRNDRIISNYCPVSTDSIEEQEMKTHEMIVDSVEVSKLS